MTLLSSVSERGRAASARSMVEPQPPIRARIAPFAGSLPSAIGPWGARASQASTSLGDGEHPPAHVGQLVLDRVGHAAAHVALEGADPPQIADLAAQGRLRGATDPFAQIRQAQRPVEMGPQDRNAERARDQGEHRAAGANRRRGQMCCRHASSDVLVIEKSF